ncbi:MAG: sigma-70 family RNA polymerase sigma factor [Pirellula sp.]
MSPWPETRLSLIRRLSDRDDQDAWAYFEQHYQQPIYRFARSRGLHPDEALDVVQEVLLAVHRAAATWQSSNRCGSFRAWLAEAARRVTLQITRKRSRIGRGMGGSGFDHLTNATADTKATATESHDDEQRWKFYCAAAKVQDEVNPQHWIAFWRTAVEGKSADIVGQELMMKVGTVYSAKCRILAKLKQAIESLDALSNGNGADS